MLPSRSCSNQKFGDRNGEFPAAPWVFVGSIILNPWPPKTGILWRRSNLESQNKSKQWSKTQGRKRNLPPFSNKCWISSWFQATHDGLKYVKYVVSPNCKNHELQRIYCRHMSFCDDVGPSCDVAIHQGPILQIGPVFSHKDTSQQCH